MNRVRTAALFAALLVSSAFATLAAAAPRPIEALPLRYRVRGDGVSPRSFEFSALRHREPTDGLVVEAPRPKPMSEEAERAIEEARRHPNARTPEQMGHVTIDPNNGPVRALLSRPDATPYAPVANNGFDGISQGGYIPSEPTVAAGPLNIFSTGNSSVTVTNKDGTNRVETSGTTFFGVGAGEGGISDAQCYYDALRGRFIALCFTTGTTYSYFYLAVSKTNDARGAWWLYKFDMTKDGNTPAGVWADYQALGVSDDKIAMTGQMFGLNGGPFRYQKVRVLDRAAVYAGLTASYFDFVQWPGPTGGDFYDTFVTKAARNLTAGDNDIHLFCVRTGGGKNVTSTTIFGPPSSPSMSVPQMIPVREYGVPLPPVQKGSAATVPITDCRPTDFYVRNGVLSVAFHEVIALGGQVSAIRLLQVRMSDLAVITDETYAASGTYLYYPAVTVDSVGTIFLGYDRSSSTEYPSAYITGKRRSDATLQPSLLLKAGVSPTAQSRWGDYTGIDNDAAASGPGGSVAWYSGQYTKGTNTFGTWVQKVTFPYGQISGTVQDDCDGSTGTSTDRAALAGVTVALLQGATTLQTTTTDATGAYRFGWLDPGTYDVVVTAPSGGSAIDAVAGTGATTQTRMSASDIRIDITATQTSTANQFVVTSTHLAPVTTSLTPYGRVAGSGAFTLTVKGANFARCASVRWDGADRVTTWLDAATLTAAIPAGDAAATGTHAITVFQPAPGGGTSNVQTFRTTPTPDTQAPTVTLTAPAGGQSLPLGVATNITWSASDDLGITAVDLAWSSDGGATFPNVIASGIANTGSFSWTPAGLPTTAARVRVRVLDSGGNVGSDSSHTNVTLTGWTITASAGANGSISPAGVSGAADGATPAYTITPASGFRVLDVLVNGASVGAVTNYVFAPVHANQTISASFATLAYPLNITLNGSGTVTRNPDLPVYAPGTSVTITATPAPGWGFDSWSGDINTTGDPTGVTMGGVRNVTANFSQHVYTWNQTGTADWTVASNWTPARNAPATDDKLVFSNGASIVVTNMPTQSIGQLVVTNNTTVSLQPSAAQIIDLTGRAGPDLVVDAGSTLDLTGSAALTIALDTGASGLIAGTIDVANAAHRLTGTDGGSLVFTGGSKLLILTGFAGNIFGNGSLTSHANAVVMQNGSLLAQATGSNPFGFSVPNTAVIFQAGSRYRVDGNVVLSVSGRTYADFEYNYTGALTASGPTAFSVDSLIVTRGTLNWNMTGGGAIRGDLIVRSGATLNMNPASGTPVAMLAGTLTQGIELAGTFSSLSNQAFEVNNPLGVALRRDFTVTGPFNFTAGRVTTGAARTLAITGTGSINGASSATGWVTGNLRRNFAAGASSRRFDLGDGTTYTPIDVTLNGAAAAFDVTGSVTSGDHPQLASSDIDPNTSVNRYWTLSRTVGTAFTNYDATFRFAAGDVDAGTDTTQLVARRYSGGWTIPALGARTGTSVQATGLTAFGDFAVGQVSAIDQTPPLVTLTAPNGGEVLLAGGNSDITWTASDNIGVSAIDLYIARDGRNGTYVPLATGLPNTGVYH